ncbi:MAG TPA: FGGY-family carbohydrate kinase, partial [Thermoanaerobaculia bacterium]|nr:FGGY-family carbohydrate kinase [Thermoanaerobaculia bacterium]
ATNASRTLLLDIHRVAWDDELCAMLRVPKSVLPDVRGSSEIVARTKGVPGLPDGIPIGGIAGDQQAALFGQACFTAGLSKVTYGTGAFVLLNTGEKCVASRHGLLSTVAWRLAGKTTYALEGSAFIAGAAVQWLRDGLGLIASASEVEALAASVPDSGGVTFVPALTGLGAPYGRPEARGLLSGLTRGTTRAHVARAVLEGVALQVADILEAMAEDAGVPLAGLRVDGGAARNDLLMQEQADLLGVPCVRPTQVETTAIGAAYLAGLGVDLYESPAALARAWQEERRFMPRKEREKTKDLRRRWREAVAKA